jgi:HEAT repeat protein
MKDLWDDALGQWYDGRDVTEAELEALRSHLKHPEPDDNIYQLLHVISHVGEPRDEPLVASYLECREDPMATAMALHALCAGLGLARTYEDALRRFARGVEWDADEDVRFAAISEMGEMIRNETSVDTIELLIALATDASETSSLRSAATSALGRGVGLEWKEMHRTSRLTSDTARGERIMTAARSLLAD